MLSEAYDLFKKDNKCHSFFEVFIHRKRDCNSKLHLRLSQGRMANANLVANTISKSIKIRNSLGAVIRSRAESVTGVVCCLLSSCEGETMTEDVLL